MASQVTGKRKRDDTATRSAATKKAAVENNGSAAAGSTFPSPSSLALQVVTGSYERVLHGFSATIPSSALSTDGTQDEDAVAFSDTFLFAAHTSAIRCLAVSPPTEADKRFLATGSSDERINVYSVSTAPPLATKSRPDLPVLSSTGVAENARNRSLGSLVHHDRAITGVHFASKTKLFSSAEDNTIAISRSRDWTVLSSIKAPIPKPVGRPSGDTAAPGETPAGVNSFAIHPSQKLMLSVGRGEKCMRLWNLMTGKKAGVLNFDRDLLSQVGEGPRSSGEGRYVLWDESGASFIVGFDRGAAVFGVDSKPKAVIRSTPPTKFHKLRFVPGKPEILSVSTEDGRILFFDTSESETSADAKKPPSCPCIAQLGGSATGLTNRVKDFEILQHADILLAVTASSDGAVRFWRLNPSDLESGESAKQNKTPPQIGTLLATRETGSRITCLGMFPLDGKASDEPTTNGAEHEASPREESSESE